MKTTLLHLGVALLAMATNILAAEHAKACGSQKARSRNGTLSRIRPPAHFRGPMNPQCAGFAPASLRPAPAKLISPREASGSHCYAARETDANPVRIETGAEPTRALAVKNLLELDLGRFAEPAVRRLSLADPTNRERSNAAWELLARAFSRPAPLHAVADR